MTNLPLNGDASTRHITSAVPANEIKVRARLLLNALRGQEAGAIELARSVSASRRWAEPAEWTLTHCMNIASARAGFQHWDHARCVLGGEAADGDDAGTLWYDNACEALTNQWFAHYTEARAIHDASSSLYLLPYRRQFIVVDRHFIELLGLDASDPAWTEAGRDLVGAYGSPAWRELAMRRLRAMRR